MLLRFLLPALMIPCALNAQSSIRDSAIAMHVVGMGYTFQLPGGDMADRFGWNSMLGLSYTYKFKSNLCLSANGGFLFGSNLREDGILDGLKNEDGLILGDDGKFADVRLYERGYHVSLTVGKIFSWNKPNPNAGLFAAAGPGFLQHKIRIETIGNTVPQLNEAYRKGYDRLTNGVGLHEIVGYHYFGNRYLINFYVGFEFIQSFTKNRRDVNFDTMSKDDKARVDLLYGVRAGWMLPLYRRAPHKYYFY
jgi:hypothetical protein